MNYNVPRKTFTAYDLVYVNRMAIQFTSSNADASGGLYVNVQDGVALTREAIAAEVTSGGSVYAEMKAMLSGVTTIRADSSGIARILYNQFHNTVSLTANPGWDDYVSGFGASALSAIPSSAIILFPITVTPNVGSAVTVYYRFTLA